MSDWVKPRVCAEAGCEASFKPDRWNSIRAQEEGWFLQRDGTVWCPEHLPNWLDAWRASRKP